MSKLDIVEVIGSPVANSAYRVEDVINGDLTQGWFTKSKSGEQYLRFDLGSIKTVGIIKVYTRIWWVPLVFDVYISNTTSGFVLYKSNCTVTVEDEFNDIVIPSVYTRYIKLVMVSAPAANNYNIVDIELHSPIAKTLIDIQLITLPDKKVYYLGESLDLQGLEVRGTYEDGPTEMLIINNDMVVGFDSSNVVENQIVTIEIEGFSVIFLVDIIRDKRKGEKIIIEFTLPLIGDVSDSVNSFKISGKEYIFVDGPDHNGELVNKEYSVTNINKRSDNVIELSIGNNKQEKFRNTIGYLKVEYNSSLGNLQGEGGEVESFIKSFMPDGLQQKGNPRIREYINASLDGNVNLIEIKQIGVFEREYIQASLDGVINLIYIDPINP